MACFAKISLFYTVGSAAFRKNKRWFGIKPAVVSLGTTAGLFQNLRQFSKNYRRFDPCSFRRDGNSLPGIFSTAGRGGRMHLTA